jgi:hypothetical protein
VRGGRGYETASLKARGEAPIPVERIMRDFRINLIFEGSSEIMRLFIAREALDKHLAVAGDLVNPKAPLGKKLAALPRIAVLCRLVSKIALAGLGRWPRFSSFGSLATRAFSRTARKLARTIFTRGRTDRSLQRQALLFRAVTWAPSFRDEAAVARRRDAGAADAGAAHAATLADLFCRNARRRIASRFREIRANDDVAKYAAAQTLLAGDYGLLEKGLVDETAVLKVPAAPPPVSAEELIPAR